MDVLQAIETLLRENVAPSTLVLAVVAAGGALITFIGLTSIRRVSLADEAARVSGLREPSLLERVQARLGQSGLHVNAAEFVAVGVMLGAAAAGVLFLLNLYAMGAIALAAGPFGYYQLLMSRRDRRMRDFREQLPDAIDDFKEFYRAGNGVIDTAVNQMARHAPPLFQPEFERVEVLASQLPGNAMQEALRQVGRGRGEPFFRQFFDALANNKASGGPLEPVLERIARSQRTQLALQNQIRSQQAGGRIVGLVYGIAPPLFVVLLRVGGGMFADFYESLGGQALQVMAVAAGAFSYWAVLRIGRRGVYLDEVVGARLNPGEHADLADVKNYDPEAEANGAVFSPASFGRGDGADAASAAGTTGFDPGVFGPRTFDAPRGDQDEDDWLPMSSVKPSLRREEESDDARA